MYPSWNGRKLEIIVPWGTIEKPTTTANKTTMEELSEKEKREVKIYTQTIAELLGYGKL
jgi:hypothetical protein